MNSIPRRQLFSRAFERRTHTSHTEDGGTTGRRGIVVVVVFPFRSFSLLLFPLPVPSSFSSETLFSIPLSFISLPLYISLSLSSSLSLSLSLALHLFLELSLPPFYPPLSPTLSFSPFSIPLFSMMLFWQFLTGIQGEREHWRDRERDIEKERET